jgi:photosystem II stability/assembly factor-like uncharacterized protein
MCDLTTTSSTLVILRQSRMDRTLSAQAGPLFLFDTSMLTYRSAASRLTTLLGICFMAHASSSAQPAWKAQLRGFPDNLWHLSAVDRNTCWVLGLQGSVLRTGDAGATWKPVAVPVYQGISPSALVAFDSAAAILGLSPSDPARVNHSDTSRLLRTSNGGRTWEEVYRQPGGFFNGIHRLGRRKVICLGNPAGGKWTILHSSDSGRHWTILADLPADNETGSLGSTAARGERCVWFGAIGPNGRAARLYRSTDGGQRWSSADLPVSNPHTLDFRDSLVGVVATSVRDIARTGDGGVTWSVNRLDADEGSGDVASSPDGQLWLTQHRSILSSSDAGLTWTKIWTAHPSEQIVMKFDVVMDKDSLFGWVTTYGGGIIRFECKALRTP